MDVERESACTRSEFPCSEQYDYVLPGRNRYIYYRSVLRLEHSIGANHGTMFPGHRKKGVVEYEDCMEVGS
jgi:hypothetical protein